MFAPVAGAKGAKPAPRKGDPWKPVTPVECALIPKPHTHPKKGMPAQEWAYLDPAGQLLGYTWRIADGRGGKEFVYLTWCRHVETGEMAWRWKAWGSPRPLYGLDRLAIRPDAPVLVCEGEKCADAAQGVLGDWVVVTSPGGSNAGSKADWSVLNGRRVVVWPDADGPGRKYAQVVTKEAIRAGADTVALVEVPEGAAAGWDVADAIAEGWSEDQILSLLQTEAPADAPAHQMGNGSEPKAATGEGRRRRPPQRDGALALIKDCELWCDEDGASYITMPNGDHWENWPLQHRDTKRWLITRHRRELGESIGGQALEDVIRMMDAMAADEGGRYRTFHRVGFAEGKRYLDLCDDQWRAVEVTANGWQVVNNCPIKFVRSASMRPLPVPEAGSPIEHLRGFVNVRNDEDFMIICAWLTAAYWGEGPYPILAVSGEQGSGKSNLSRILRAIADPNYAPIRSAPKEDVALNVSAHNSYVLAYDNLSGIPAWLSDALCRIATGGGHAGRSLYSNNEESVMYALRPIILNGIPDLGARADLADRSLSLHLPAIAEENRQAESDFWQAFNSALPEILGAVLDAISSALRNIDQVKLDRLPRMADFAKLMEAASPGLGWEPGQFIDVYDENRADMAEAAFEANPVAVWIDKLLQGECTSWEGNATKLLQDINAIASDTDKASKFWPGSASSMGTAVRRAAPSLRDRGLDIDTRHSGSRVIRIARRALPD